MDALTRAFVGFPIPEALLPMVTDAQMELKRRGGAEHARWSPPTDWIVTLCPLGEVSPAQLDASCAACRDVALRHAPFELALEGVGGSPNATQPRHVWCGVSDAHGLLQALHADLEATLAPMGLPRESRPLQAQVPLGRLKAESEQGRSALGRAVRMAAVQCVGVWTPTSLAVLRTTVGPSGPVHVPVELLPLGSS